MQQPGNMVSNIMRSARGTPILVLKLKINPKPFMVWSLGPKASKHSPENLRVGV